MTEALTTSDSTVNVISIPSTLTINLLQGFDMQSLYDGIINQYNTSTYTVLGIDINLLGRSCLEYQTVDPTFDIKEATVQLFEYLSKLILKPVLEILGALAKVLSVSLEGLFEIPVLGLTLADFFKEDLWEIIAKAVRNLWETSKEELESLLKLLGIPWPFFDQTEDPELSIRKITKDIASGIWQFIFTSLGKLLSLIKTALLVFDLSNYQSPKWSIIWDQAVEAIIGTVAKFLVFPFTLDELYKAIIEFAKATLNLPIVTFKELIDVVVNFELPIFGSPLDWTLPLNDKIEYPEKDFSKILSDMLIWFNNFMVNIFKKFIEAIGAILNFFAIPVDFLTEIQIPIAVCVVENQ